MTKVTLKEEAAWKRVLDIELDAAQVDEEWNKVLDAMRKRLNLPGFRKGKVPRDIARQTLGKDLDNEVVQRLMTRGFQEALKEKELNPIGDPVVEDVNFQPGEPMTFKIVVEVAPQVEISGYKGLQITKEVRPVEEDQIDQTIDSIREARATLKTVERPSQRGDVVVISYVELNHDGDPVTEEPTEVSLEVGGEKTPEVFTQELDGVVVGDMKKVPLEYPADYADPELAGKTIQFHVTVKEVQEKVWPEVTDEFAQEVLEDKEAKAQTLRDKIRENMEASHQQQADRDLEGKILNRLMELNEFDLPENMVLQALNRVVADARKENPQMTPEDEAKLTEGYRPLIERQFRTDVMIGAVGRQEGLEVDEAEVEARIEEFAAQEGRPAAKIKAELKKEGGLNRLKDDIYKRKVVKTLVEAAEVSEVTAPVGEQA